MILGLKQASQRWYRDARDNSLRHLAEKNSIRKMHCEYLDTLTGLVEAHTRQLRAAMA